VIAGTVAVAAKRCVTIEAARAVMPSVAAAMAVAMLGGAAMNDLVVAAAVDAAGQR